MSRKDDTTIFGDNLLQMIEGMNENDAVVFALMMGLCDNDNSDDDDLIKASADVVGEIERRVAEDVDEDSANLSQEMIKAVRTAAEGFGPGVILRAFMEMIQLGMSTSIRGDNNGHIIENNYLIEAVAAMLTFVALGAYGMENDFHKKVIFQMMEAIAKDVENVMAMDRMEAEEMRLLDEKNIKDRIYDHFISGGGDD